MRGNRVHFSARCGEGRLSEPASEDLFPSGMGRGVAHLLWEKVAGQILLPRPARGPQNVHDAALSKACCAANGQFANHAVLKAVIL